VLDLFVVKEISSLLKQRRNRFSGFVLEDLPEDEKEIYLMLQRYEEMCECLIDFMTTLEEDPAKIDTDKAMNFTKVVLEHIKPKKSVAGGFLTLLSPKS